MTSTAVACGVARPLLRLVDVRRRRHGHPAPHANEMDKLDIPSRRVQAVLYCSAVDRPAEWTTRVCLS